MSDTLLAKAAPTGRLRLRTSHPLAQRLALLMPLRGPADLLDLVSGRSGTRNGTPGQALGRYGEAVLFGAGNSVEMPQPTGITSGTEPVTILWLQEPRSPSGYSAVVNWKPSGATNAFAIYQAAESSYHFACGPRAGSVPRFAMGAPTDGRLDAFALVCAGGTDSATLSNYTLYRNGVPFTTGSSTTFGANSSASARIGALNTGGDPFEGLIGHLHIVRGAMLPAEVSAWFDDPFALEDDGRRIWLPPQAAGGSSSVETDAALTWALRGAVETSAALSWPLRAAVQADAALTWPLRGQVQTDAALTWPLRAPVVTDAVLSWDIEDTGSSSVVTDAVLSWALRGTVQADAQLTWPLRSAVQADAQLTWPLRAAVQADAQLTWPLRAAVVTSALLTWLLDGDGAPPPTLDPGAHPLLRFLLRPPVRLHAPEPPQRRFPLRPHQRRLPVLQGSPRTSAMPTERINPGAKLKFELDLRPTDTSKPAWLMTGDRITAATWSVGTGLTKVSDSHTDTVATVLLEAAADAVVGTKLVATCVFTTEQGERDSRRLELEVVRQ